MGSKNSVPLIFLLAAFAGFSIFLLLESVFAALLSQGNLSGWGNAGNYLQLKIQAFGQKETLDLLPQLKFRWLLLCLFGWWMWLPSKTSSQMEESSLRWRVRLFFVVQLLYIPELLAELNIRWRWAGFFEPPFIPGLFFRSMPPLMILQFAGLFVFGISAWLVLTKWKNGTLLPAVFALLVWFIWTFLLSIYQSGGTIDHAYASLHSAQFFMAVFLFVWWKFPELNGLGHRLFQAGIWACYFFSGMEKIFLSGWDWFSGTHFELLCLHHPGSSCGWLASHPWVCTMLLSGVGLFQLLSPLQWRYPRWGYVTLFCGMLFHTATWLVLNVGGWQSPWFWMLLFLLPVNESGKPAELSSIPPMPHQGRKKQA